MENLPIEYDINEAYIAKETDMYKDIILVPDDPDSYAMVMSGLKAHRKIRLAVEKKRKSNNESAKTYIDTNNAKAKELHALNDPGEQRLKDIRQVEDDRLAEIEVEEARKERERVDLILYAIQGIRNHTIDAGFLSTDELQKRINMPAVASIDESFYMEFSDEAKKVRLGALQILHAALIERTRLDKEDAARKLEAERLEELRLKYEKAQKAIDAENARQKAERQAIEDEKAQLEAAKKAEQDRKEREEFERKAKEKADIQAGIDAKIAAENLKIAEANQKIIEEEAADRQEALKPDKQKMKEWAAWFTDGSIPSPKIEDEHLKDILDVALGDIGTLIQNVLEDVEAE